MSATLSVRPATGPLRGRMRVPGDKSISHRALLFGALAEGTTRIRGLLRSEDVLRTLAAVRALGCDASTSHVTGAHWRDAGTLDCGNSGTTARLLAGALAGRASATLDGDASLRGRPMGRVARPLRAMGAVLGDRLPLTVTRAELVGVDWVAEVASAQVKSAVLLAGLCAAGETRYTEPVPTRDHTERLLAAMGAPIARAGDTLSVRAGRLHAVDVDVPGDVSSAAFWLVAACIVPGSDLVIEDVGLNPTRTGVLDALSRMGADLSVERRDAAEPIGTVRVRHAPLRGTTIAGAEIPRLVDELPVLAVAAAFAEGETVIRDAAELRVKESDRVAATVAGLRALGVEADELPDGMRIGGGAPRAGEVDARGDHRVAMAFAIAGLRCGVLVRDTENVATSYPTFADELGRHA
ncbi:MAG: 3-phosphoshikimate 1-carboxyvinyltransferase [Myxococcota bacterium]